MAPNHGGDPLGSTLGHMGSQWVKKMGQNRKNYLAPNSNFRLPCGHRFFWKNGSYGYGAKSRWGSPGSILGPMGPIGSKKWVKTVKNYHAPKFEFLTTPRSSIFLKKWKLRLWRQITVGTLRVHLRANGSAVIDFSQKMEFQVMPPNHGGDPHGSILGPMGSHWVQKMGPNVENYHAPKFEFWTTPRSSIFPKKWKLRLWRQITVGTP